uniref:B30.2/SPRY domain-containing protein n=1 Tax=Neogobius melanostomus TaxID=47308 RepID=A0A8C6UZK1_9GOBI
PGLSPVVSLLILRVQRHAVDIKLDPETANPHLLLSADLKQVTYTSHVTVIPINKSKRFSYMYVIADRGFSSGRFYFEVSVGQKEEWVLGLIEESVPRNKRPVYGIWALYFRIDKFCTYNNRNVPVGKVERVGVFVDYDKGLISFYDRKTATRIYSYTRCVFTEKICPFLCPCNLEFPTNWLPMTIVPVGHE